MLYAFIAFAVGISIILQSGINQQVSRRMDLSSALFFNGLVCFAACAALFVFANLKPQYLPEMMRPATRLPTWHYGLVISGICGFIIVCGMPLAINKLGALRVTTLVIATQLTAALAWDRIVYDTPMSPKRILSAIVTMSGAILSLI